MSFLTRLLPPWLGYPDRPSWDVAELQAMTADLAKPPDSVYLAQFWEENDRMQLQHAEHLAWHGLPVPAYRLPSLAGLPEVPAEPAPKPVRVRANRVKAAG